MRRATLPSGSVSIGSDQVRLYAARALLSDVLVSMDLPPGVRKALKKVGELINPEYEGRSNSSELLTLPPAPNYSFPHCGGRISVHEDEDMHSGESIFDWSGFSNVMGLPQISEDCTKGTEADESKQVGSIDSLRGVQSLQIMVSFKELIVEDYRLPESAESAPSSRSIVNRKSGTEPTSKDSKVITVNSGCVYRTNEIDNDRLLATLDSWRFPIYTFGQRNYKTILSTIAYKTFEKTNLFQTFKIDLQKFFNFFHAIENGYRDLPYHNRVHASDVLHACYFLTTHWLPAYAKSANGLVSLLSPLDLMALYTAAAIHDHDHPGRNNAFMVATRDPKAVIYNDRSVLENHHVSSAWRMLIRDENCFIENLSSGEFKRFRHYVIDTVLSTDLKYHYDLLMHFTDKVSRRSLEMSNDSDSLVLGKMILKLADVNSATKPAGIHQFWSKKILEEFFEQGDEERRLGLPISDFMDRRTCNVAELQRSFMNHVVSPLLTAMYQADLLPVEQDNGHCELLENFAENLCHWRQEAENTNKADADPSAKQGNAAVEEEEERRICEEKLCSAGSS